jgi:hypothetical protein
MRLSVFRFFATEVVFVRKIRLKMRSRILNFGHSENIKHNLNAFNYESPTEIYLFFIISSIDMNALTGKEYGMLYFTRSETTLEIYRVISSFSILTALAVSSCITGGGAKRNHRSRTTTTLSRASGGIIIAVYVNPI